MISAEISQIRRARSRYYYRAQATSRASLHTSSTRGYWSRATCVNVSWPGLQWICMTEICCRNGNGPNELKHSETLVGLAGQGKHPMQESWLRTTWGQGPSSIDNFLSIKTCCRFLQYTECIKCMLFVNGAVISFVILRSCAARAQYKIFYSSAQNAPVTPN